VKTRKSQFISRKKIRNSYIVVNRASLISYIQMHRETPQIDPVPSDGVLFMVI